MARNINVTFNADFRDFDKAMAHFKKEMGMAENVGNQTARSVGESFGKMGQLLGGYLSARAVADFGRQVVTVRGQFQVLENSFRTMLGSEKEATKLMEQLMETATKTTFDMQGVASGAKSLLAYGESAETVNETLLRLSDIASGLSIPLNDLVYLYGTTMTQGRVFTQDIRQFMGRGIPIMEELAKVMNVSKDEVSALVTAGKVGFPEVQKALQNMTNEGGKFYNMSVSSTKSLTGAISNLSDSFSQMLNEIGKGVEGGAMEAINFGAKLIENYEKVGIALAGIITTYGTFKAAMIALNLANQIKQYGSLIEVIKKLTIAQKLLNSAVLTNPYVALGAIIAGLGASMYLLATQESEVEKSMKKVNEERKRTIQLSDQETDTIRKNIDIIKQQKASYEEIADTLKKLRSLQGYENITVADLKNMSSDQIQKLLGQYNLHVQAESNKDQKAYWKGFLNELDSKNMGYTTKQNYSKELREVFEKWAENRTLLEGQDTRDFYEYIKTMSEQSSKDSLKSISTLADYVYKNSHSVEEQKRDLENQLSLFRTKLSEEEAKGLLRNQNLITQYESQITAIEQELAKIELALSQEEKDGKNKLTQDQIDKNIDLEEKYNQRVVKAKSQFYRDLEQAEINHQKKMAQIKKDESEYTGDKIDFNAKRKEEKERYTKETQEIVNSYQDYIKGINEEFLATTRTERENLMAEINNEYLSGIEDLKTILGENHPQFEELSEILKKEKEIKELRKKSEFELEDLEKEQKIKLETYDAIYEREQTLADLRNDEELAHKSTQGYLQKRLELLAKENELLQKQKQKYEEIGDVQSASNVQIRIDDNALKQSQINVEMFDNSLKHLTRTVGTDLDLATTKGISNLIERFGAIKELTEKIKDAKKRLNEAQTDEKRTEIQGELNSYEAAKSQLASDTRNALIKEGSKILASGVSKAAEKMHELADATGDVKMKEMAEQASAMADVLSNTAQGFSQGGWVGAVIAFATSMIEGIVDSIQSAKAEILELETNIEDFQNSMKTKSMLFDEDYFENIFGTDKMGKMQGLANSIKKFGDSYKSIIKDIEEDTEFKGNKERRNVGLAFLIDPDISRQWMYLMGKTSKEYQTYIEGIKKGYNGLENMLIKTKDRSGFANLFGLEDEYTSLKDLAPELWDGGEFNVDNAKIFLETNTQITEEQKKQLQTIVDQKEQYEEYNKQLEDMLRETFGEISDSLADALINSVNEGTNAIEEFREVALDVLSDLEQQMVSSIFNAYMGNFQDKMKEIIGSGGGEIEISSLIGEMFNGLHDTLDAGKLALDEFRKQAKEYGYDLYLSSQDAEDEILKGSGLKLTAQEIKESNGNFFGLKMTAQEINSNVASMKAIAQTHNDLLRSNQNALMAIVTNTAHLQYIREDINNVRGSISVMRSDLDNINRKGVALR